MSRIYGDTSIKYYRRRLNIRQSDLAEKLGIKPYLMSFIETKKLYPDTVMVELLSHTLEVPIGKLYSEEELNLILFRNKK